jgi:two-component system chemotaxis response regulator CheY
MEQTEFNAHRVLMLGPKNHAIQVLRSVLVIVGVGKIVHIEDAPGALDLLAMEHFHAVFCLLEGEVQSEFVVAARRRSAMLNPTIPIFMLQTHVKRRQIEKARDSGVTDFLTTPVSPKTVAAKLKAAMKNPRPFIVAQEFFGPDRRAKSRPAYLGNDRRKKAPRKMRLDLTHN